MTVGDESDDLNSTVRLAFQYLEIDYVRAQRAHFGSPFRIWLDIAIAVGLAVFGCVLLWFQDFHWFGVFCVGASAVFGLVLFTGLVVTPRWVFRREPKLRDEYSLSFSPQGIHFRTAHIDSQLQWSVYSRALVDARSYLLYHGARQWSVIPRRVFQSGDQQQAFERLLTEHVPQIVRRDGYSTPPTPSAPWN